MNDQNIPLEEKIIKYPGDTEMIAKLKELTLMKEMIEYIHELIDQQKKEMSKKYSIQDIKIPKNIISLKNLDEHIDV